MCLRGRHLATEPAPPVGRRASKLPASRFMRMWAAVVFGKTTPADNHREAPCSKKARAKTWSEGKYHRGRRGRSPPARPRAAAKPKQHMCAGPSCTSRSSQSKGRRTPTESKTHACRWHRVSRMGGNTVVHREGLGKALFSSKDGWNHGERRGAPSIRVYVAYPGMARKESTHTAKPSTHTCSLLGLRRAPPDEWSTIRKGARRTYVQSGPKTPRLSQPTPGTHTENANAQSKKQRRRKGWSNTATAATV